MPVPEGVLHYLIGGIEGTPHVLSSLLSDLGPDDSRWDARPDPDRFTLREMVAHLADWDTVFFGRVERLRDEEDPMLKSVDEGALCETNDYASQLPLANLARLTVTRPKLASLLHSLSPEDWDKCGHREFVGDVDMLQLAVMILGHDAYHLRQAAEYVGR
jgi:DinB superfamily